MIYFQTCRLLTGRYKSPRYTEKNLLFQAMLKVPLAGGNGTFDTSNIKDIALRKGHLLLWNTTKFEEWLTDIRIFILYPAVSDILWVKAEGAKVEIVVEVLLATPNLSLPSPKFLWKKTILTYSVNVLWVNQSNKNFQSIMSWFANSMNERRAAWKTNEREREENGLKDRRNIKR